MMGFFLEKVNKKAYPKNFKKYFMKWYETLISKIEILRVFTNQIFQLLQITFILN